MRRKTQAVIAVTLALGVGTSLSAASAVDRAPLQRVTGGATGIIGPFDVARDAAGYLYVANWADSSVTVHPPGATGNAAPVRRISGANTGLALGPTGIALDKYGYVYVATADSNRVYSK